MSLLTDVYAEKDTWIHNMDPRIKLILWFIIITTTAFINDPIFLFPLFLSLSGMFLSSKPHRFVIKFVFTFGLILCLTYSFWWATLTRKGTPLIWIITDYGIWLGIGYALRGFSSFMCLVVLFTTTRSSTIVAAMESLHVPHVLCFAVGSALRFIPDLLGKWSTIRDAQKSRGAQTLEGGMVFARNFIKFIRDLIAVIIPLLTSIIRIASQVSLAMDSRSFSTERKRRSTYYIFTAKPQHYIVLAVAALSCTALVSLRIFYGIGWLS